MAGGVSSGRLNDIGQATLVAAITATWRTPDATTLRLNMPVPASPTRPMQSAVASARLRWLLHCVRHKANAGKAGRIQEAHDLHDLAVIHRFVAADENPLIVAVVGNRNQLWDQIVRLYRC